MNMITKNVEKQSIKKEGVNVSLKKENQKEVQGRRICCKRDGQIEFFSGSSCPDGWTPC